jgi:hypothetical protein
MSQLISIFNYYSQDLKHQKYHVIDSFCKASIIDGLATGVLFTLPLVPYIGENLVPGIKSSSFESIAVNTLAYTLGAFPSYMIRTYARDYGEEYKGGFIGGAFKYVFREIFAIEIGLKNSLPKDILSKAIVGAANNFEYEVCNNIKECNEDINTNIVATIGIEAFEGYYTANVDNVSQNVQIGATAGLIASLLGHFAYSPSIYYARRTYDLLEDITEYYTDSIMKSLLPEILI